MQDGFNNSDFAKGTDKDKPMNTNQSNMQMGNSFAVGSTPEKKIPLQIFEDKKDSYQVVEVGQQFGRYKVQGELGCGGMGIVYKAYDTKLKRTVALKVILKGNAKDIKRFIVESQAMAQLNHPNIVGLHEFGESPQPFFTMEYVEGFTLADLIKEKKVKPLFLIDLMIKVCDALAHAHKHGILHRDIKPSNIMITSEGEPKVMDFGLAKISNAGEKSMSKTGEMLGTILYMAPEQINGKPTNKSDIYSIGATIYEALTYRNIYQGDSYHNIFFQILQRDPILPRQLNPDISPYFEAVCLKCIAKKENKRYESFKQLSKELKNFKSHKPIIAKRYTKLDAIKYFISQNKILCSASLLVLMILIISLVLITSTLQKVQQEKQKVLEANNALTELNNAIMQSLNYIRNDKRYNELFVKQGFRGPLIKVFQNSIRLRTGKEYKFLRALMLGQSERIVDIEQAINDLTSLINSGDQSAINYANRGFFYYKQGKLKRALLDYNKAIELDPKLAGSYQNRGDLYNKQKKHQQALLDYNKAIELNPKFVTSYYNRGNFYYRQKKYQQALLDYNKAIELNPKFFDVYYNRGKLYYRQKKYQQALLDYNKVIELNPKLDGSYNSRGNVYQVQGKYQQALLDYNKAIELNPKFTDAYHNRAILYYAQGKYRQAIVDWEQSIALGAPKEKLQSWINKAKKLLK